MLASINAYNIHLQYGKAVLFQNNSLNVSLFFILVWVQKYGDGGGNHHFPVCKFKDGP